MYGACRDIFLHIGNWLVEDGFIDQSTDVFYLTMEDLQRYCMYGSSFSMDGSSFKTLINNRKFEYASFESIDLPDRIVYQTDDLPVFHPRNANEITNTFNDDGGNWQGVAVSKGIAEAEVVVMLEPNLTADVRGKILVSKMTDPGWVFLMSQASALISEKGSLLSHTAIVGRELGIPVVVAVPGITKVLKTGDKVRVNGSTGVVERI
jgi:pyruvate,water dikinase